MIYDVLIAKIILAKTQRTALLLGVALVALGFTMNEEIIKTSPKKIKSGSLKTNLARGVVIMGFFSFITQDTERSITNKFSPDGALGPIFMRDNKGNVWREDNYEGYGVFGGKDFYELVAEMNGYASDRNIGISIYFGHRGLEEKATGKLLFGHNRDFFNWGEPVEGHELTPNQLIDTGLWVRVQLTYPNAVFPSLTEDPNWKWKEYERPEDCPNQGYF